MYKELVMETTHDRKGKCKTEFKAVVNKVLVSGLVLATLMTSTVMPAMAATNYGADTYGNSAITQVETGFSIQDSLVSIKNTIAAINEMRVNGTVNDDELIILSNQIYLLEKSISLNGGKVTPEIITVINDAEKSVEGLSGNGADRVNAAIAVVRATLGIESAVVVDNFKSGNTGATAEQAVQQSTQQSVSFSDIQGHWGKPYIQAMANKGAIKGYEDGTFRPDQTILKSEFLAIAIRSTFPDYDKSDSSTWWANEYNTALAKGIITEYEMPREVMDTNITREEMTMIMVRCVEAKGENLNANYTGVASTIKDYMNTGEYYRTYVVKAYTSGLIQGKENNNFDPQGVATRAESATVLYRLENKDARTPVQFVTGGGSTSEDLSAPITIYEGQERTNRLAKEGDTFVKADGTKIVLKKGPSGVLGEGQGVAPDLGFTWTYKDRTDVVRNNESFDGRALTGDKWVDSIGANITSNTYYVNPLTGEGHWESEWSKITQAEKKVLMQNDIQGKANGELSPQGYFIWHNGKWVNYIANQYLLTDYYPNLLK